MISHQTLLLSSLYKEVHNDIEPPWVLTPSIWVKTNIRLVMHTRDVLPHHCAEVIDSRLWNMLVMR